MNAAVTLAMPTKTARTRQEHTRAHVKMDIPEQLVIVLMWMIVQQTHAKLMKIARTQQEDINARVNQDIRELLETAKI
jgi:hypothetical protein